MERRIFLQAGLAAALMPLSGIQLAIASAGAIPALTDQDLRTDAFDKTLSGFPQGATHRTRKHWEMVRNFQVDFGVSPGTAGENTGLFEPIVPGGWIGMVGHAFRRTPQGAKPVSMADPAKKGTKEGFGYKEHVPYIKYLHGFKCWGFHCFANELGFGHGYWFGGLVRDNARARSLGLAGKLLSGHAADIYYTDENCIVRTYQMSTDPASWDPFLQLMFGMTAFGDTSNYVRALTTGGQDPDKPAASIASGAYWVVDGLLIPKPTGLTPTAS